MTLSIRDDSDVLDPSLVQLFVSEVRLEEYCQLATVTVLIYEAVLTMDKEAEFFWEKSLRQPVTLVYYVNRYLGIFGATSNLAWNIYNASIQTFSFSATDLSYWFNMILIDYILMIRVLALYSKHKMLSAILKTLLGMEAAAKLVFAIYSICISDITAFPIATDVTSCSAQSIVSISVAIIDWTIPMLYGLLLMALALFRAAEYWKLSSGFRGFELVKVLIQDQALYFLAAVACCLLNIMENRIADTNAILSAILTQAGSPSFLSILGSRMLFNLKEAGKLGVNEGTNYRVKSVSNIQFVEPNQPDSNEENSVAV